MISWRSFPREFLTEQRGTLAPEVQVFVGRMKTWACRATGKSVSRQVRAEVQGAMVDGERGIAYSKGSNLVKYPIDGIP